MKLLIPIGLAATFLPCLPSSAQVLIETVRIGNPGNVGQPSGASAQVCGQGAGPGEGRVCGAVDYVYEIGRYEVTVDQYVEFLNAVAGTDTYALYNTGMFGNTFPCGIVRSGETGAYSYAVAGPEWSGRPVTYIAWADALRFANWMHNGQPHGPQDATTTEDGSYTLNGATTNPQLQGITRNPGATWVIPTEDEWYKAAYHKNNGPSGSYWDFATRSDDGGGFFCAQPAKWIINPDPGNSANFSSVTPNDWSLGPPFWRNLVGEFENSASEYGTFDQSGNVWEWTETRAFASTQPSKRTLRGGSFYQLEGAPAMHAATRLAEFTAAQLGRYGFRLARVDHDCNGNGVPDQQDLGAGASHDYNYNGLPDECDIAAGRSLDCNGNLIPDEAEVGMVTPTPYTWDDGTRADPIGFGLFDDGIIAWLNHFTVRQDQSIIDAIGLSFGYTDSGKPLTLYVWSDPNGDGHPGDAQVLASVNTVTANTNSDTLNAVDIPDVDVGPVGTSFFVGAIMTVSADDFPVNIDDSGSLSGTHFQSWLAIEDNAEGVIDPNNLGGTVLLNVASVFVGPVNVMVRALPAFAAPLNDADHNGVPDDCSAVCDPDFNLDGNADQDDVAYLINVIGGGGNPTGRDPDFTGDGNADQDDVSALINTIGGGGCP